VASLAVDAVEKYVSYGQDLAPRCGSSAKPGVWAPVLTELSIPEQVRVPLSIVVVGSRY
jgi:hypothetical protein